MDLWWIATLAIAGAALGSAWYMSKAAEREVRRLRDLRSRTRPQTISEDVWR